MRKWFVILLVFTISCKQKAINQGNKFITKTGKTIIVTETHPKGASLSTIEIRVNEFPHGNHFVLEDVDPIAKITLEDLDNNGFDELYIITKSVGSGTYGSVFGYASNNDKSLSPIYFPELTPKDFDEGGMFEMYEGHDTFYFEKDKLVRHFPIYLSEDINKEPVAYNEEIIYRLKKGEASWQLKPMRTYSSDVIVIKNCTGTYIKFKGLDYKVCNEEMLANYNDKTKINITFKDSKRCVSSKGIDKCDMYNPFVDYVEVIDILY